MKQQKNDWRRFHLTSEDVKMSTIIFKIIAIYSVPVQELLVFQNIREAMSQIMSYLGVIDSRSWNSLLETSQACLLRKSGIERWEVTNLADPGKQVEVVTCLKKVGLLDEKRPSRSQYHCILFMGATFAGSKKRLQYLNFIIKEMDILESIYVLTGTRPLTEFELKEIDGNDGEVKTEADALRILFKNSLHSTQPVVFISSNQRRPNTDDTVRGFLEYARQNDLSLHQKNILVVSNAPYVLRQAYVAKTILHKEKCIIDSCGPGIEMAFSSGVILDEFARLMYQYQEFRECQ